MKTPLFTAVLLLSFGSLFGQSKTYSVILTWGDTVTFKDFSEDSYSVFGTEISTGKVKKITKSAIVKVIEGPIPVGECEYVKNEIDDMTGHLVKRSQKVLLTNFGAGLMGIYLYVSSSQVNEERFLIFELHSGSIFSIDSGAKVLVKCQDEKVHELVNLEYVIANGQYKNQYSSDWSAEIVSPLTPEMLKTLLSCGVVKIRFYLNKGFLDVEVAPKSVNKLITVLKCVE